MSVPLAVDPTSVHFDALAPGALGGASITSASAPSATNLTARIETAGSPFSVFSVTTSEWRWEVVDPGELPPGHKGPLPRHRVLEQVAESDGVIPLAVQAGQVIEIIVNVLTPNPTSDAPITNALLIQGDGWDTARVPLALTIAHVTSTLDRTALIVPRGGQTEQTVSVRSVAGADTAVIYTLHDGPESADLRLDAASVWVASGQQGQTTLRLHAAPEAALGDRILFLTESAFGGAQTDFVVPGPTVTVVQGAVAVSSPSSPGGLTAVHGGTASAEIDVSVQGAAADVYLSAYAAGGKLPAGVSMNPVSVHLDDAGFARTTLQFSVDPFAPVVSSGALVVVWSAYAGTVSGTLSLPFTIVPTSITFTAQPPFQAGDVECTHAEVVCSSDGTYLFSGSLHDHGALDGDKFVIGFAFKYTDQHGGAADLVMGTLGAVFGPPRDTNFKVSAHQASQQEWVRQNWPAIFAHGATFHLKATPDFSQPFSDLVDAIKDLFSGIQVEGDGTVGCYNTDGSEAPDCQPTDEDGGDELAGRIGARGVGRA